MGWKNVAELRSPAFRERQWAGKEALPVTRISERVSAGMNPLLITD